MEERKHYDEPLVTRVELEDLAKRVDELEKKKPRALFPNVRFDMTKFAMPVVRIWHVFAFSVMMMCGSIVTEGFIGDVMPNNATRGCLFGSISLVQLCLLVTAIVALINWSEGKSGRDPWWDHS